MKMIRLTFLAAVMVALCLWMGTVYGETNTYVFDSGQSTLIEESIPSKTYNVSGRFQLTVDAGEGTASFDTVNAAFSEDPKLMSGDLGELFYMVELIGNIDGTKVEFQLPPEHPLRQSYDIHIRALIIQNDHVHLTGHRFPLMVGEPGYTLGGEAVGMGAYESGRVWYVDAVGGSDSYDGQTPETAFATIQKAVDSAEDGDYVVVLAGTYTGPGNRDIDFKGKAITVRSADPDDPNVVAATIIDCNGTQLERHRGFFFHSGENESSVLAGLTITNGYAYGGGAIRCEYSSPTIIACVMKDNGAEDGGGLENYGSSPTVIDCVFSGNSAENGGGMYNEANSTAKVTNCIFIGNTAINGGGMDNYQSGPELANCVFSDNSASVEGGAIRNMYGFYCLYSEPNLINCTFSGNSAGERGGGMCSRDSSPKVTNCTFAGNSALSSGGAIYNAGDNAPMLINCIFGGNSAANGGGMYNNDDSMPTLINCAFSGNLGTQRGAAIYNSDDGSPDLINCTFSGNVAAVEGGGLYNINDAHPVLHNCILYGDQPEEIVMHTSSIVLATFSDIQGGWPGEANIDADPLFSDVNGPDGVVGTEDDDLRLLAGSPCIDAGDNSAVPPDTNDLDGDGNTTEPVPWDLDGNPRILPAIVDMGAYEFQGPFYYYVDGVNGDDENHGWSPESAFATIQKSIDSATDGYSIWVSPGRYSEEIDFLGKAITVAGAEGAPVVEAPDYYAVSFYHGEGPNSVLKNFVIKGSYAGLLFQVASPTITNVTVVKNRVGALADAGANPSIRNSIFWYNTEGDLFGCGARYSCIQHGGDGEGNIRTDPLFADPGNDDYHLRSERGRYWPEHNVWVLDELTSPCVDSGDPTDDPSGERMPNGGRINMGAYGGASYASMSEGVAGDVNYDGVVDFKDLAIMAVNWLQGT